MKSSNLVRIAMAFLIGVAVTLGSALLYFRTTDIPPERPSRTVSPAPEPSSAPESERSPGPDTPTPAKPQVKPPTSATAAVKSKPAHPIPSREPKQEPVTVVAQSDPPPPATSPLPAPMEPPKAAVNEPAPSSSVPNFPAESSAPVPDPAPQPHVVMLQAGTNLAIRLGETLSSDHNYTGDTFRGTLEVPVIVDGFIIADRGSKVLGKVTNAQQAGRVQGLSGLTLALTEINTTDGQRVQIHTDSYEKRGVSSTGSDAATIAGGAALGAMIGAIAGGGKGAAIGAGAGGAAGTGVVLATRGKPTAVPVETKLNFRLAAPVTITEQIHN